jgi:hypothetical protein
MSVEITSCTDAMMWYCDRVGESFPLIRQLDEEGCYLVRTDDDYQTSNIVLFCDGELVDEDEE